VDVFAKLIASCVFATCGHGAWARRRAAGYRAGLDAGSGSSGSISSREPPKVAVMVQDITRPVPDRRVCGGAAELATEGGEVIRGEGNEAGAQAIPSSWRNQIPGVGEKGVSVWCFRRALGVLSQVCAFDRGRSARCFRLLVSMSSCSAGRGSCFAGVRV
jgi:hypothetical protein